MTVLMGKCYDGTVCIQQFILFCNSIEDEGHKPQTLLFSATLPPWVYRTAQKYMKKDVKKVDLIGQQQIKTSTTVQVCYEAVNFRFYLLCF